MTSNLAITITRVGLAFDFFAFFLAAPELLGESGLRKFQERLRVILFWGSIGLFVLSLILILPLFFLIIIAPLMLIQTIGDFVSQLDYQVLLFIFIGPIVSAFLSWIPNKLMIVVEKLVDNGETRKMLLNGGIMLFVLGALAQFIGTF